MRGACVHLAFHPGAGALVVAAADKYGAVALWDVERRGGRSSGSPVAETAGAVEMESGDEPEGPEAGSGDAGAESEEDGVLDLDYHRQYVSGLKWAGGGGGGGGGGARLFTASYDGSVRAFDPGCGGRAVLVHGSEEDEYSAMDVSRNGDLVLLGNNDGELALIDTRMGGGGEGGGRPAGVRSTRHSPSPGLSPVTHRCVFSGVDIADKKINTVGFEPGSEMLVVTSSTDSSIKIWDLRRAGPGMTPLLQGRHAQTCQAAHFCPDGSRRIASTSFDDTVRVWDASGVTVGGEDGADGTTATPTPKIKTKTKASRGSSSSSSSDPAPLVQTRLIQHNNHTGRWVLPFRAVWAPDGGALAVGSMRRAVDVLDPGTGKVLSVLSSEHMTAIASRNAFHPTLPVMVAATNSGRLHIYRG